MLIIGETINVSIKSMAEAISNRDEEFISNLARQHVDARANMLDVNAGSGMRDEMEDILWLIRTIQKTVDIPLVLDNSNPEVLVETPGMIECDALLGEHNDCLLDELLADNESQE